MGLGAVPGVASLTQRSPAHIFVPQEAAGGFALWWGSWGGQGPAGAVGLQGWEWALKLRGSSGTAATTHPGNT